VGVLALDNPPYLLVDPIAAGSTTHDDVKKSYIWAYRLRARWRSASSTAKCCKVKLGDALAICTRASGAYLWRGGPVLVARRN
jgi:hypothetical protein